MGHSFGDGLIVASLAAALVAYFYFRHAGRQRRAKLQEVVQRQGLQRVRAIHVLGPGQPAAVG